MEMNTLPEILTEQIIEENIARTRLRNDPNDPVKGDPNDPGRFLLDVAGFKQYIPLPMKGEVMVSTLLKCGSVEKYLREIKGCDSPETRDAFTREWDILRSRHDFPYWAAKFAYIKKKGGGDDILFTLNRPQRKLVDALEDMRRNGKPIRLILLKARQWGGSTCIQIYMAWLQLVHKTGLNSLIIAHQGCATDEIKDMFDRMLAQYPEDMLYDGFEGDRRPSRPTERVGGAGAAFRVIGRNCKVKIGTAERPDSCRGGDYNLIHCSEVGLWKTTARKNAEDIHRAACSGVLFNPLTMILMESTANGTGNFFHKEYEAAKSGESQFKALFVAWYEIEQYSLPFSSEEERREFAASLVMGRVAQQAVSDRRQPGKYLWQLWERGASLEAIHWYVKERAKYSDHGLMAAEYPSDDVEAFVHSGARVFDKYRVEALRAGCRTPALRGEIDGDAPSGERSLCNVRLNQTANGALAVWKDRPGCREEKIDDRFLVVVDIGGRSRLADWSVITVLDRAEMCFGGKPEVAAQWRGHTDFDLLAWNAARIATYYDNALLVIESNTLETRETGRQGEADQSCFLLNQIRYAYPNLYARRRSEEDIRQGKPLKFGFHTNTATKPMVISTLVKVIREGMYVERDEGCLAEYLTYEQRQNGSYGALQGCHDDILMTRAIGLHICFQEMRPPQVADSSSYRGVRHQSFF
ncbi:MAG: terminase [Muribaculaceae bacterium]|nr:terminase [Muribaculaceae bacterium]